MQNNANEKSTEQSRKQRHPRCDVLPQNFYLLHEVPTDPLNNELKGQSPDYAHPLFVKKTIELSY